MTQGQIQLGKNGITENFIKTLESYFKKNKNVKVSVLQNLERDKEKMKKYSKEILEGLGKKYTAKIVGFTIFIKKWRKEVR